MKPPQVVTTRMPSTTTTTTTPIPCTTCPQNLTIIPEDDLPGFLQGDATFQYWTDAEGCRAAKMTCLGPGYVLAGAKVNDIWIVLGQRCQVTPMLGIISCDDTGKWQLRDWRTGKLRDATGYACTQAGPMC